MASEIVAVVFDGPPGPEAPRFVEVEDEAGASIRAGMWFSRADGLWELRLRIANRSGS